MSRAERSEELLLIGLRLTRGIERARFQALAGIEPEAAVNPEALSMLIDTGFLEADAAGLRATPEAGCG
ncbi:MAG: hypothetical protein U1E33_08705 [Rhodospirillales bacterium]